MRRVLISLNILLSVLLLIACVYVIEGQTLYRDLGARITSGQKLALDLEQTRKNLETEKSQISSNTHIERTAQQRLKMQVSPATAVLHVRLLPSEGARP